jgi:hypothetical protein
MGANVVAWVVAGFAAMSRLVLTLMKAMFDMNS